MCGKLSTWSEANGNSGLGLCKDCFEAASLDNEHYDGYHETPHAACRLCKEENEVKTYELFMRFNVGTKAGVDGDKPVKEFKARNDKEAFDKAQDVYDALPSRNITVAYMVREKGTNRLIVPDEEVGQ